MGWGPGALWQVPAYTTSPVCFPAIFYHETQVSRLTSETQFHHLCKEGSEIFCLHHRFILEGGSEVCMLVYKVKFVSEKTLRTSHTFSLPHVWFPFLFPPSSAVFSYQSSMLEITEPIHSFTYSHTHPSIDLFVQHLCSYYVQVIIEGPSHS